ncbi:hypothetical protein BDV97DRAFT_368711 [Delphinella strobiligena]|nr:hypothetical protein BDV97DRAFT_368711 [Delphinella strobiligena]
MKAISILVASAAALCAAQDPSVITVHPDGSYTCTVQNAAYCAGTSLDSNLIIRCVNGSGQVGNCDDNLAGEAPDGVNFSPCWQSSPTAGDAACSKNGTVYPDSGSDAIYNCTAPFPVPGSVVTSAGSASGTTTSTFWSTLTTYLTGDSTLSGYWSTYTTPAASPSSDLADATTGIPSSTTTLTSWSTVWMSDSTGTVFVTLPTTTDTTICPENASTSPIDNSSMTASSMTGAITPSVPSNTTSETTTYTTWSTISSAATVFVTVSSATASSIASAITPSGPVYTFSTNSTTFNLGPGPASTSSFDVGAVGTASATSYSFAPSGYNTSSQDIVGAASASDGLLIPYDTAPAGGYLSYTPTTVSGSSTASSSMGMAGANTTVVSPSATAGPIYTGAAAKYGNAKVAAMVAFGFLVVALV